ncbi:MAG: O-methyltransferase [Deltaproteobacteria bacterium]|nr:O-methyltransferase [Deltaproteobacteria bacterium]
MDFTPPAIDNYLHELIDIDDPIHEEMLHYAESRRFPAIGPLVGKLCQTLALSIRARRVFELGSGFGYSAYWFAEAVGPDGIVYCTDTNSENADMAREFLGRAGLLSRVKFTVGDAVDTLRRTPGPFDVILNDIDKEGYPAALPVALEKLRTGGLLITDNLLWSGRVANAEDHARETEAIRRYTVQLYATPGLSTTLVPLRDGVGITLKVGDAAK